MIEDTQEKSRRNFLIVATGIIAAAYFRIPLDGKLIGVVDLDNISLSRAWFAAIVVLTYFALRFHLAPRTTDLRSGWHTQYETARDLYTSRYVRDQYEQALQHKKTSVSFKNLRPSDDRLVDRLPAEVKPQPGNAKSGIIRTVWGRRAKVKDMWEGQQEQLLTHFSVGPIHRLVIAVKALKSSGIIAWPVLETGFPYAWGTIAMVIAITRFALSFFE